MKMSLFSFLLVLGWVVLSCPFYRQSLGFFLPFGEGTCYGFYANKASWTEAVDFCKKKGFALAQLTGPDEYNRMMYQIGFKKMQTKCVWTGLSDPEANGQWRWLDGEWATKS